MFHTTDAVCGTHDAEHWSLQSPTGWKFRKGDRVLVDWNGQCYWAEVNGTTIDNGLNISYDDGSYEPGISIHRRDEP